MIWTLSPDVLIPEPHGTLFEAFGHTVKVVSVLNASKSYTLAEVELVSRKAWAAPIKYREGHGMPSVEMPAPVEEANV